MQAWPALAAVVVTSSSVARALARLAEPAGLTWARPPPLAHGGPTAARRAARLDGVHAGPVEQTPEGILTATLGVIHD